MAIKSPADKAELSRKISELRNKEGEIQENLLRTMERQAELYDNEIKKLAKITSIKAAQEKIQKELFERQINTNFLEDNIAKRSQKIIDNKKLLVNLQMKYVSTASKALVVDRAAENSFVKLAGIWDKVRGWQQGKVRLNWEEYKLVKATAGVMGMKAIAMKNANLLQLVETKEIMRQATIQSLLRKNAEQKYHMKKETLRLAIEERKEAKATVTQWLMQIGYVSEYNNYLNTALVHLKAMGVATNKFSKLMKEEAVVAGGMLLSIFKQVYNLFLDLDKAAFEARKEMGMMRREHSVLRKQAEDLYKEYAHLGVEAQMVYKTQIAITKEFGSSLYSSKEIVKQASLMSAQFGIAEETTVRMLKTLGQMGQTTAAAQTNMVGFAGALSNAAGVPLQQVMEDVAKASETTRTMISKVPLDMIKAAVEARRMGTTLDKMTSSSRKLLNFTESMEAEMEASVLLGRPINLQLARQLAYSGKIIESNKEILRIAKQTDFEHMDVFQMEAFARATGKSVEELQSMLQADRQGIEIRAKAAEMARQGDFSLQNQLKTVEELQKANEAVAKARGKDYDLILKNQANQERLTAISNSWKKVIADAGMLFLPLIDNALKLAAALIPIAAGIVKVIGGFNALNRIFVEGTLLAARFFEIIKLSKVGGIFLDLAVKIEKMFDVVRSGASKIAGPFKTAFSSIMGFFGKLMPGLKGVFGAIGKLKFLGTALGTFGKAIPIVGEVIMVLQGLWSAGVRVFDIFKKFKSGDFWGGLKGILLLVPGIIWDVLVKPILELVGWIGGLFSDSWKDLINSLIKGVENFGDKSFSSIVGAFKSAWDWIKSSVSGVWSWIVNGLSSIGEKLFNNVITPFQNAWSFVTELWSQFSGNILSSLGNAASAIFEFIISPYRLAWDFIKTVFTNIGPMLLEIVSSFGQNILTGIGVVAEGVFNLIISPYTLAFDAIKNIAANIGPLLLDAVSSIGNMMFDYIISPFKRGWDYISGLFGGGGPKVTQPTIEKSAVNAKAANIEVPVDRPLTTKEIKSYKELDKVPTDDPIKKATESTEEKTSAAVDMQTAILAELKNLNSNLLAGKIGVNMDGQSVEVAMKRGNEFRGNYGAMVG